MVPRRDLRHRPPRLGHSNCPERNHRHHWRCCSGCRRSEPPPCHRGWSDRRIHRRQPCLSHRKVISPSHRSTGRTQAVDPAETQLGCRTSSRPRWIASCYGSLHSRRTNRPHPLVRTHAAATAMVRQVGGTCSDNLGDLCSGAGRNFWTSPARQPHRSVSYCVLHCSRHQHHHRARPQATVNGSPLTRTHSQSTATLKR